jgi:hypothetical protein
MAGFKVITEAKERTLRLQKRHEFWQKSPVFCRFWHGFVRSSVRP